MYNVHIFIWIIISNYIQIATKIRYILFICPILGHFELISVLCKTQWHSMFREDYYTTKKVLPKSTTAWKVLFVQTSKSNPLLNFLWQTNIYFYRDSSDITIFVPKGIVLNVDRFNTKMAIYDVWIFKVPFLLIFIKFQDWFESTILVFWYTY